MRLEPTAGLHDCNLCMRAHRSWQRTIICARYCTPGELTRRLASVLSYAPEPSVQSCGTGRAGSINAGLNRAARALPVSCRNAGSRLTGTPSVCRASCWLSACWFKRLARSHVFLVACTWSHTHSSVRLPSVAGTLTDVTLPCASGCKCNTRCEE